MAKKSKMAWVPVPVEQAGLPSGFVADVSGSERQRITFAPGTFDMRAIMNGSRAEFHIEQVQEIVLVTTERTRYRRTK